MNTKRFFIKKEEKKATLPSCNETDPLRRSEPHPGFALATRVKKRDLGT